MADESKELEAFRKRQAELAEKQRFTYHRWYVDMVFICPMHRIAARISSHRTSS